MYLPVSIMLLYVHRQCQNGLALSTQLFTRTLGAGPILAVFNFGGKTQKSIDLPMYLQTLGTVPLDQV